MKKKYLFVTEYEVFLLFTNILGIFFKCIFTILLQIQHENIFYLYQQTPTRQSQSLSWYLFVRLLHLSLKFRLPKMSRNETPSWLRSQNSEQPRIFRVTGANQNARKVLFTDLVNTKIKISFQLCYWTIRQWSRKINQPSSESVSTRVTELEGKQQKWKIEG